MADTFDALADFRMDDHNVIITGGAQNIGAGIARTLAGAGAQVMIADLQGDKAKATAQDIAAETGSRCMGMACDVTKKDDIDALVAATVEAFGGISTLVNNVRFLGLSLLRRAVLCPFDRGDACAGVQHLAVQFPPLARCF